eukprot:gnl/MRDRNA2_/MRDRNA2_74508_c0_seq1.p1 gnl/MRDRNA2_/MRDRNA2_74508_c0~~gnl/MRDRNA2_/MRDRNA2_74508_c0_seq1.p1  ORF type:complete len:823 (-),score=115.04 gnl/MRDRNA2_/MRDRNA2_74508_c0_seq1:91-2559(-)
MQRVLPEPDSDGKQEAVTKSKSSDSHQKNGRKDGNDGKQEPVSKSISQRSTDSHRRRKDATKFTSFRSDISGISGPSVAESNEFQLQASVESSSFKVKFSENSSRLRRASTKKIIGAVKAQTKVKDESEVYSVAIIISAILVAACCGVGAFTLHLAVTFAGCLSGVNGCSKSILLDLVEPFGIDRSLYFILSSGLSGFLCSCIIYSPWNRQVARNCLGGGSAGTKIAISSGQQVSGWVVILRIVLAGLYMGGGNTLGTEGPVVHLGTALATYLTWLSGTSRRKIVSLFGVIGASAGISAGFNVLITGFIYTSEELTRTISRRLVLLLTLAAAAAMIVKDSLEKLLEHWFHIDHVALVPERQTLAELTSKEIVECLCLCLPIGVLNGIAGWCLTRLAWSIRQFLNPQGKPSLHHILLPRLSHLAIIGIITGSFGAIAYKITGVNGVWGTTIGAIPEAIVKGVSWKEALLLFLMKFLSFALATAGGGPGGMLVPSLVAGGFLGLTLGLLVGDSAAFSSACSVVGMGSLFASVMHLPVSGVIIIFELTESRTILLPVVIANFVSSNVATRLPSGEHSFPHLQLHHDPIWEKLGKQDFIETDAHETSAETEIGFGRVKKLKTSAISDWFKTDVQRLQEAFKAWKSVADRPKISRRNSLASRGSSDERMYDWGMQNLYAICEQIVCASSDAACMGTAWRAWLIFWRKKKDSAYNGLDKMLQVPSWSSLPTLAHDIPISAVTSDAGSNGSMPDLKDRILEDGMNIYWHAGSAQRAQSIAAALRAARSLMDLAHSKKETDKVTESRIRIADALAYTADNDPSNTALDLS